MPLRLLRGLALGVVVLGGAGCSQFNLVAPCTEQASLPIVLIPRETISEGRTIDRARVLAIAEVSGMVEVDSAYNERTCRGRMIHKPSGTAAEFTVRIQQSEGARDWGEYTFLNIDDPEFQAVASMIIDDYARTS